MVAIIARMTDPSGTDGERVRAGLCYDCVYARRTTSARGSTFYLCERSVTDPTFPRYPRLPVVQCAGYESRQGSESRD